MWVITSAIGLDKSQKGLTCDQWAEGNPYLLRQRQNQHRHGPESGQKPCLLRIVLNQLDYLLLNLPIYLAGAALRGLS